MVFDIEIRMEAKVKEACQTSWISILKIRKIREYLTQDQVKTVIHAYVAARLENNNALPLNYQWCTDSNCKLFKIVLPGLS